VVRKERKGRSRSGAEDISALAHAGGRPCCLGNHARDAPPLGRASEAIQGVIPSAFPEKCAAVIRPEPRVQCGRSDASRPMPAHREEPRGLG
jgi:hypothetical protein